MYTNEIKDLQSVIEEHLETARKADLEREELRLQRFQSLLLFIDEAHGAVMKQLNDNFAILRNEVEAVMNEQCLHAEKMGAVQGTPTVIYDAEGNLKGVDNV